MDKAEDLQITNRWVEMPIETRVKTLQADILRMAEEQEEENHHAAGECLKELAGMMTTSFPECFKNNLSDHAGCYQGADFEEVLEEVVSARTPIPRYKNPLGGVNAIFQDLENVARAAYIFMRHYTLRTDKEHHVTTLGKALDALYEKPE